LVRLHIDLAGRGLAQCEVAVGLRRGALWDRIEGAPTRMERVDPVLGLRLVEVSRARADRTGATDPAEWDAAALLFGPVPEDARSIEVPEFQPVAGRGNAEAQRMVRVSLSMFAPRRVAEA
jgi:hypothetical protein